MGLPPAACSCFFERFPVGDDIFGAIDRYITPDVRVAVDHLGVDRAENIRHAELAVVGGDLRVEDDLQQQVAQFFDQRGGVFGVERL